MTEAEYHKKRRMFCIINDKIYIAPEKDMRSHKKWLASELKNKNDFNKIVRGIICGEILTFYIGDNFDISEEAERIFFENLKKIVNLLKLDPNVIIGGGHVVGKVGEVWPPKKIFGKIKDFL